jgi:hypothetical protein
MIYIIIYIMVYTWYILWYILWYISCTCCIYHATESFTVLHSLTILHRQLSSTASLSSTRQLHCPPQTAGAACHSLSCQAKATVLHVPLQCSQVDLNQLVIWILNEWLPLLYSWESGPAGWIQALTYSTCNISKSMVQKLCNYVIYHDIYHYHNIYHGL